MAANVALRPTPPGGPKAQKPVLSGAASRGYSVASAWEHTAVLSEEQELALELLSEYCAQRPLPEHVLREDLSGAAAPTDREPGAASAGEAGASLELGFSKGAAEGGGPLETGLTNGKSTDGERPTVALEECVLQNSRQFYRWHGELEAARTAEAEGKFREYAAALGGHLATCDALLALVDSTLEHFESLKAAHRDVAGRTRALSDGCGRLVAEEEALAEFAGALSAKLAYFDELERIAAQFHTAALSPDADRLLPLLQRLDECLTYVSSNPQYADSTAYAGRFRALQARALASLRSRVQIVLRHAAEQVQQAMREARSNSISRRASSSSEPGTPSAAAMANGSGGGAPLLAEGAETALLYVRFRAAAEPGLKGLLAGLAARGARQEYAQLLADCQRLYCEVRLGLVEGVTAQRVAAYAREPLPQRTRSGCAYLMQVCQLEHQLFDGFFPGADPDGGALGALMDPLCTVLYDALRPAFIHLAALDPLCELVDILQHEVLEEQLGRRGDAVAPLRPVLLRTLADVQQRLTFRVQAFIKEEVAGFQPSAADLDYLGKLQRLAQDPAAASEASQSGSREEREAGERAALSGQSGADAQRESAPDARAAWYPPVQRTLACLSRLYRCVEHRVFAGLAQDAVASCAAAVQVAARAVAKRAGAMDGQLFLIKQLLILREQIAPFEADFYVVEKELDFSHMRDHLRRILSGQSSLFTLSADNAVVQLLNRGGPRVLESQVDSKKELEKLLKATCEAFIMAVTKLTVEPMLSFITKVTAVRVAASAQSTGGTRALREQAFAAPERLAEMAAKVREALAGPLPAAVARMRLYLANPATHAILFKPIKSNIAEAHGQVATLLEAEYPPSEAQRAGLTPPGELAALLDALC
ncbi:hypothetical protein WJX81_004499 [Elliptochloris bilobata]|uniref:Conserved oligomeric Golgi complex subunit 3 n=1 Tax=Elliptochloris bilobata TaxID=381761 RepID=A0AAW1SJ40_9CHLO